MGHTRAQLTGEVCQNPRMSERRPISPGAIRRGWYEDPHGGGLRRWTGDRWSTWIVAADGTWSDDPRIPPTPPGGGPRQPPVSSIARRPCPRRPAILIVLFATVFCPPLALLLVWYQPNFSGRERRILSAVVLGLWLGMILLAPVVHVT